MRMIVVEPLDLNAKYINAEIVTEYRTENMSLCRCTGNVKVIENIVRYVGDTNIYYDSVTQLDTGLYLLYNNMKRKFEDNIEYEDKGYTVAYRFKGHLYFLLKKRD